MAEALFHGLKGKWVPLVGALSVTANVAFGVASWFATHWFDNLEKDLRQQQVVSGIHDSAIATLNANREEMVRRLASIEDRKLPRIEEKIDRLIERQTVAATERQTRR